MTLLIDEIAKDIALTRWALPECLHVPIAAVDEESIRTYVGDVERVVSGRGLRKALLVMVPERRQSTRCCRSAIIRTPAFSTPVGRYGFT